MKNKLRVKNNKKFLIVGLLSIFVFGALFLIYKDKEEWAPHQNPADFSISQHYGTFITPNAIATNPEFGHIAFAEPPRRPSFLSGQFASVVEAIANWFKHKTKEGPVREYGSWIWTPVLSMTPEYIDSVLSGAKSNRVNVMYVSVDSYLDIFVMKEGKEKEEQEKAFTEKLEYFLNQAKISGIEVDAEAGWQNWAEAGNEYKAYAVLDYVKRFNDTHINKFRGFQYDVEPYMLDSFKQDPASVLANFVGLVDRTEYFLYKSDMRFSVVVPDFYDKKDGTTPKFSYGGSKDYVLKHLLKILDRRASSSIIVMSYRNFADGKDGAIEVSKNEMQTAKRALNTKIIIAQETGEVPPPYITFHNTSKKYFSEQIDKINSKFNSQSNFGGIAVHYINAYLALK